MTRNRAKRLHAVIGIAMQSVDDETALENASLFPAWETGVSYAVGTRVYYNGVLYRVLQNHVSQDGWTPDAAASLFARVLIPEPDVIPEWERPDSTNPYMRGDKVRYNGVVYESLIDNNTWSPEEYPAGWQEVQTEAPSISE